MIHGLTYHDYDFTPRPVFYALQNTNALFADTKFDLTIEISSGDLDGLRRQSGFPFLSYGFRSKTGKAIVAYWIAAHSAPGNQFPSYYVTLSLKNSGIQHPVLIDVLSGDIRPLEWKDASEGTLEKLPVTDSIMAIADAAYFDWPILPEAPSSLNAVVSGSGVKLTWQVHGGDPEHIVVERREDSSVANGSWQRIAELSSSASEYMDRTVKKGIQTLYRVHASNTGGDSATSNTVRAPAQ